MSEICEINESSLAGAGEVIKAGGLVVLPTDTVYGIACNPFDSRAVARIYQAKQRPLSKPLQVLMSSVADLERLGLYLSEPLERLAEAFLPGPFSPIAQAREDCRLATVESDGHGQRTQGVRVPDSEPCLRVLRKVGPLACSSANRSGQESAQTVHEAFAAFGDDVDLYLDGGPTGGHVASTVVMGNDGARYGVEIVREGKISSADILSVLAGEGAECGNASASAMSNSDVQG